MYNYAKVCFSSHFYDVTFFQERFTLKNKWFIVFMNYARMQSAWKHDAETVHTRKEGLHD